MGLLTALGLKSSDPVIIDPEPLEAPKGLLQEANCDDEAVELE